jgi:hypothetical protein
MQIQVDFILLFLVFSHTAEKKENLVKFSAVKFFFHSLTHSLFAHANEGWEFKMRGGLRNEFLHRK